MTKREKLLDKLAKLVALESSPNLHEAEAARRQAERFMRKHGLRREDAAPREVGYHEVVMPGRRWGEEWKFRLVTLAARSYGAQAVRFEGERGTKVRVAGEHADVVRAVKLCRRLFRVVRDLEIVAADVVERGDYAAAVFDDDLPRRVREDSLRDGFSLGLVKVVLRYRRPAGPSEPSAPPQQTEPPRPDAASRSTLARVSAGFPPASRAVARTSEATGKDHSSRVESRYRPSVRAASDQGLDDVWRAFGQYLVESRVVVGPGLSVRVRKE